MDKRFLIFAAKGLITWIPLLHRLTTSRRRAGAAVMLIDNLSTGRRDNLLNVDAKIVLQKLDICHTAWPELLANEYDVIFHLAGDAYVPASVERPGWDGSGQHGSSISSCVYGEVR